MKKQGFTLGEVAITIAVVGFLAAMFLPMIKNAIPNQEQIMFKKAYYLTERSVSELINDEDYYPESDEADAKLYFANTVKIRSKGKEYQGTTKFCELFALKLNKASTVSCTTKTFVNGSKPVGTLTATDSVVWILPITDFADETTAEKIYMDVNGDKKPNCFYNKTSCKAPDRFTIKVYQDGRVEADGTMEVEYLNKINIGKDSKAETSKAKQDLGIN